jgi:diguanylate cyclase (GGDEF)-like protein/PAS domain S-box-containing protein
MGDPTQPRGARTGARGYAAAGAGMLVLAAVGALSIERDVPGAALAVRLGLLAVAAVLFLAVIRVARDLARQREILGRRETIMEAAAGVAARLVRAERWDAAIGDALATLGSAAGAHRVYVFANRERADGTLVMDELHEWVADGFPATISDPENRDCPWLPRFSGWMGSLREGRVVAGPTTRFAGAEREDLLSEDVRSVAMVPIFAGERWWGFIGFDDCLEPRRWSPTELGALSIAAETLGAAIHRDEVDAARRDAETRYRSLVEHMPAITYIDALDDSASTQYISPQVEEILGYTTEEWLADPDLWPRLLHPDDRDTAVAENQRHNETLEPFHLEYRLRARDGRTVWIRDDAVIVRDQDGRPSFSQGIMQDITERKLAEERVAFLAYHDEMTGLPNRAMFDELLELAIARARRHDGGVAVLCVDLDDFRLVNESLGHDAGDRLLGDFVARLQEATRETDLVARRGGDEFLLLLADLEIGGVGEVDTALATAEAVVGRIREQLAQPFALGDAEVYVSASTGISVFPADAQDGPTLVSNAEAAMHESKALGPGGYAISSASAVESMTKLSFVTRLRRAVELRHWMLHYQPIVDLATGGMVGVEALLRWRDPDGEVIPPNEFIPLAEELGLIETISGWVVEELVRQDQAWRAEGIDVEVGFNLSSRQLWQPDLAETIVSKLAAGNTEPNRVVVEITETSAMRDPDRAQWVLWELHDAGLRLAIDDFGTGYSSLWRLRALPVDVLKIDRSFVSGVDGEPQSASIVRAFIQLAHALGKQTLAEGIETEGERRFLVDQGCLLGQGYLFSRPVPPEEITRRVLAGELAVAPRV